MTGRCTCPACRQTLERIAACLPVMRGWMQLTGLDPVENASLLLTYLAIHIGDYALDAAAAERLVSETCEGLRSAVRYRLACRHGSGIAPTTTEVGHG